MNTVKTFVLHVHLFSPYSNQVQYVQSEIISSFHWKIFFTPVIIPYILNIDDFKRVADLDPQGSG